MSTLWQPDEVAVVRGERVTFIGEHDHPVSGTLGATVDGANMLVEYPDGERGYVRPGDLSKL